MQTRQLLRGLQAGVEAMKAYRQQNSDPSTSRSSAIHPFRDNTRAIDNGAIESPGPPQEALSVPSNSPSAEVLPPTVIRTSEKDWLPRLTRAYREHAEVELIDDAALGVDPATQSLLQMGLAGKLTRREWTAVAVSSGMTVFGAAMVVLAIMDPEPTSKLGLLVASGALLALTGGFQTVRLLTRLKPPSITISARGIHIDWGS